MAYAAVKGLAIKDGLASSFVHLYYDMKLHAELGLVQNLDELDCYDIEALRRVSIGVNRALRDERRKQARSGKAKRVRR